MATLQKVTISEQGIIKNILSLDYNHQTTVKEYLNNVVSKNVPEDPVPEDPVPGDYVPQDYAININMKDMNNGNLFLFEFEEKNASGFSTMEELVKAFRIADSERSGTNNMGYGIYSPITINKGHDAMGLFVQDNENGRFYSVVHFNSTFNIITSAQGELEDIMKKDIDITFMTDGMVNGTKFVWITYLASAHPKSKKALITPIIKNIRKHVMSSRDKPCMEGDVKRDIMELGKYYYYYLKKSSHPVSITYGDVPLVGIDILQPDDGKTLREQVYETSIARDTSSQLEYRILDDSGTLRKFNKSTTKPFGGGQAPRRYHGVQKATVRIFDIDEPNDRENKTRSIDRMMWVKIGETYIISDKDLRLQGWPNIRVVIELNNEGENEFDYFITPNANKSKSAIDEDFKKRLIDLVKYTTNTHFSKKKIIVPDKMKHDAWEIHIKKVIENLDEPFDEPFDEMSHEKQIKLMLHGGQCAECFNEISVWKYDAILISVKGEIELDNIHCVCKGCGKGAIRE